jgi:hypothetical protein
MFKLKVDPNLPHHYIIGVAMRDMLSSTPGKMFLKYGPLYFTNDDVERVGDAATLSQDEIYKGIYKMSNSDICDLNECSELVKTLWGLKMAAMVNHATLHHFSCEVELTDANEFFEGFVKRANKFESERRKLHESKIGGN